MLCLVAQLCLTLCDHMNCSLPCSSVHGDLPGKNTRVGCHALLQGIFLTRDWTQVSHIPGGFLPSEPPGKPKKTAVGSLSLLQGNFLTQELNLEEPGVLQSMGLRRVRHDWATSLSLFAPSCIGKETATHSSVLAWRIPGTGEPGGLQSLGSHRVGHDWSDLAGAAAVPA